MEQKIDGLVALLAQSKDDQASSTGCESLLMRQNFVEGSQEPLSVEELSTLAPSQPINKARQDFQSSKIPSHSTSVVPQHTSTPTGSQERGGGAHVDESIPITASTTADTIGPNASRLDHALVEDVIDATCGNALLNEFRLMADCFPFVLISPDIAAQDLAKEKPMLFLAICMTACGKIRLLQSTLEQRYRKELALKSVVDGHRSLDCLQSILIYLAWYHLHLAPNRQQINQLLHMATAMAFDLGICGSPKKAISKMSPHGQANFSSLCEEREAQRALVGCYYLSTTFTIGLNIPKPLELTKYMTDCCNYLQTEQIFPVDATLPYMIRLGHLGDRLHTELRSESSEKLDVDNVCERMHLQLLQSQLEELKTEGRLIANKNFAIIFQHKFISMELHGAGLRMKSSSSIDGGPSTQSSTDTFHHNLLLSCLQSAKAYLDTMLAMSAMHYRVLSFEQWMSLPRVLAITCKLCVPSNNYTDVDWDYRTAQERVRVDLYLESLCYRLQSLTTFDSITQPLPDFWILLKRLLERIRSWYMQKIRSSIEERVTDRDADILPLSSAIRQQVSTNGYEAQDFAVAATPKFAEMDGMMNDLGNPFWVSNLFDMAMVLET